MGPVRRGLILAIPAILPAPVWAEACATFRPGWDGMPVTIFDEAIALFSTPIALILLVASMLVIRFRSSWGAVAVCLAWSLLITATTFFDPTGGLRNAGVAEGCVGSPALFIGIVAALCAGMIIYTGPPKPKDHTA